MNILISGGSGKLGRALSIVFPGATIPPRRQLDLTDIKSIENCLEDYSPDIVLHTAALTSVEFCENNRESAWNTNVKGTRNLINAVLERNSNCYFIYISTASVFRGDKGNYSEEDIPYPINFYSMTKLLGEYEVRLLCKQNEWLIIRSNFISRGKWPYPKAFTDRWGTYLFADELSLAIKEIVEDRLTGIVHVGGEKKLSMYQAAQMTTPEILPLSIKDYSGPPLPQDMTLKSNRIHPFKIRTKN